ncbi:DUF4339 domain-containing protein [bacterium]|jgi:hypothetical protein|nr:DUF4339 domain-containing protein [bacterium]
MENSGQFLFKDDSACWYIAQGEKWVGPLRASDVYAMIQDHQISWVHYVWKKGQSGWNRVCEVKPFQEYAPTQPKPKVKPSVKPAVESSDYHKKWFLHYNDSQFGPFSQAEVIRFLQIGKINPRVHAWAQGMANWQRIESISELSSHTEKKDVSPPSFQKTKGSSHSEGGAHFSGQEQRSSPRRPLLAKMILSDDQSVIIGMCRDISVGGMQVLTDEAPVKVGTLIKLNVSPSTNETGPNIPPFVAEGKVVRILEDGRGFSFRFTKLSDTARKSVEIYIEAIG